MCFAGLVWQTIGMTISRCLASFGRIVIRSSIARPDWSGKKVKWIVCRTLRETSSSPRPDETFMTPPSLTSLSDTARCSLEDRTSPIPIPGSS